MDDNTTIAPEELAGKYQIKSLLGEGAQGRTWLGMRLLDGIDVAIKELKYLDDFKQMELFLREAEVMRSLQVKGVPKMLESIIGGLSAPCYLIQEYVPYPSLQAVLEERGTLPQGDVLWIMLRVAEILYELQNRYVPPVIHRDIKPSNVLYHAMSDDCEVFLIDFGAVANPQKRSGGSTIAGTFGYMAPEQLQGNATIQSDYYALGALALHLLTGVSPCDMKTDVFTLHFDDVLAQNANVSQNMISLLHLLLAPRIEDRPANAAALLSMIRNVHGGQPPLAQKKEKGWFSRLWDWMRTVRNNPKKWPTCKGKIRGLRTLTKGMPTDVIEYTYEVQGRTYCGFINKNNAWCSVLFRAEDEDEADSDVALDTCSVSYHPAKPHVCTLLRQTVFLSKSMFDALWMFVSVNNKNAGGLHDDAAEIQEYRYLHKLAIARGTDLSNAAKVYVCSHLLCYNFSMYNDLAQVLVTTFQSCLSTMIQKYKARFFRGRLEEVREKLKGIRVIPIKINIGNAWSLFQGDENKYIQSLFSLCRDFCIMCNQCAEIMSDMDWLTCAVKTDNSPEYRRDFCTLRNFILDVLNKWARNDDFVFTRCIQCLGAKTFSQHIHTALDSCRYLSNNGYHSMKIPYWNYWSSDVQEVFPLLSSSKILNDDHTKFDLDKTWTKFDLDKTWSFFYNLGDQLRSINFDKV